MKKNLNLPKKKTGRLRNLFLTVCLLASVAASAQEKTVTGTVTDALGDPLIGATVLVQGTSNGVITDIDGRYSIQATPENTLDFSYVGMVKQAVKVGSQSVINVQMKDDSQMLAETVVIGYGSAKKRDLTGSITNIKGDEIANKPVVNPVSALQGKIAGVQVINSGKAGSDPEIRVRGTNSINGYKPLYVVDGLFNDNINFLNPQDIESMEILKDPSSLAIFGVRGANGVIIITTKKAKEGQTRVNINGSFGFKSVTDKIALTDAEGFKLLYNEQLRNEGNPEYNFSDWTGNTNWQDEIFQTGFITNNNISITGASDKNSFYLGAGYAYEQGNIKHEKYSKITLNISNDYKVTDNLKVGFQFNGARMLPADTKSVATALRAAPVAHVFNSEYGLYTSLPGFQKAQMNNPMVDVDLKANTTKAENYRGSGNVYGQWDFLKHFQFKAMFSLDYASNSTRTYTPVIQVYDASVEGDIATLGNGKTGVSQAKETEMKVQSDYLLTYTNSWGDHSVTATAGFTTYYNKLENLNGARTQGVGLVIPDNPDKWYVSIGDAATATNGSTQWERSTVSVLARVLYNYKGKYLFNGSYRRDGSSAFSYTGNQWQNFYSVGLGWLMSEEAWMKDITWLDMLKLKGSWGTLGNQNLDRAYPAEPLLTNAYSAVFGTPSAIYPGYQLAYLPNPKLRWEKVEAWEAGAEANFLRNRLHFEGVYYKKKTKDLLAEVPGISGTVPGIGNLGSIENSGVELALSWRDRIGDWNYNIGMNLATIKNKVLSLVQEGYSIIAGDKQQSYTMAGYPIGYFYGYKSNGIFQNQEQIDNYKGPKLNGDKTQPGDVIWADTDNSGTLDANDRTMIGNPNPDLTMGLSLNASWKAIDFSITTYGAFGQQILKCYRDFSSSPLNNYTAEIFQRWHGEGTSDKFPRLSSASSSNWNRVSDIYIEDGDYLKIKNITVGFDFKKAFKKLPVQQLRLYLTAQNLFTFTGYSGMDPEIGYGGDDYGWASGIDLGYYPSARTYMIGLNVKF